jgi:hypothetical protein
MTDQSKSNSETKDQGIITALLDRFENQRLPRTLRLKEKVDLGEKLTDSDIDFLEQVLSDAAQVQQLADRHPEYQTLMAKAVHLYHEITEQALKNEKMS